MGFLEETGRSFRPHVWQALKGKQCMALPLMDGAATVGLRPPAVTQCRRVSLRKPRRLPSCPSPGIRWNGGCPLRRRQRCRSLGLGNVPGRPPRRFGSFLKETGLKDHGRRRRQVPGRASGPQRAAPYLRRRALGSAAIRRDGGRDAPARHRHRAQITQRRHRHPRPGRSQPGSAAGSAGVPAPGVRGYPGDVPVTVQQPEAHAPQGWCGTLSHDTSGCDLSTPGTDTATEICLSIRVARAAPDLPDEPAWGPGTIRYRPAKTTAVDPTLRLSVTGAKAHIGRLGCLPDSDRPQAGGAEPGESLAQIPAWDGAQDLSDRMFHLLQRLGAPEPATRGRLGKRVEHLQAGNRAKRCALVPRHHRHVADERHGRDLLVDGVGVLLLA